MSHMLDHVTTSGKVVGEVIALSTIGATIMKVLPAVAAVVAILWHCLLIYDWARGKISRHRREEDQKENKAD